MNTGRLFNIDKKNRISNPKVVVKAVEEDKNEVNSIVSASQTGVKAITITTNFDATNETVTLTRGASAVSTDKVNFSDDGKTIVINTTANIVDANYKVTVGELEKSITGETSRVESIEVLSDKAAAVKVNGDYKKATVGYKVTNQFGDDITKTTSLTANSSAAGGVTLSSKDHLITFDSGQSVFMINRDVITVTLLDTKTGKSASANLTISMEAYAQEMTFEGVYNSEGKTLTEDTDTDEDTFYLLFSAVDQYGAKFKSYKSVIEGEDLFLSVMGGMTTLDKKYSGKANFVVVTKDDTEYLAYPVKFSNTGMSPVNGEATVQLLSTGGTSCTGTVTVEEGTRVTSLNVSSPGVIAAGEKTELEFVATDASGKEVTAYKILRHVEISDNSMYPLKWVKNTDGTGKLVLDATSQSLGKNQSSMQTYTFTTLGKNFYHAQLTVTETARPVAINGLQGVNTTITKDTNYVSVKLKNLNIEDQYGRVMSSDALEKAAANQVADAYNLKSIEVNEIYNTGIVKVTSVIGTFGAKVTAETEVCRIIPQSKGDGTVEFQIHNGYSDDATDGLNDATANVLFTVKDTSEVENATATVDNIYVTEGTGFANRLDYAQTVEVKAGGATLSANDYHLSVPSDLGVVKVTSGAVDVWKVYANVSQSAITQFKNKTADTVTRQIKVTLNGTGESFTIDATLCKEDPYVKTIVLADDTYGVGKSGRLSNLDVYDKCITTLKDQYGKKLDISNINGISYANGNSCTPVVTFSYTNAGDKVTSITSNGTTSATLNVGSGFDSCTMTIAFNGNVDDKTVAEINLVNKFGDPASQTILDKYTAITTNSNVDDVVDLIDGSKQLQLDTGWSNLAEIDKTKVARGIVASAAALTSPAAVTTTAIAAANIKSLTTPAALSRTMIVSNDAIVKVVTSGVITTSAVTTTSGVTAKIDAGTVTGGVISVTNGGIELVSGASATAGSFGYFTITYTHAGKSYLDTVVKYKAVAKVENGVVTYTITKVGEELE